MFIFESWLVITTAKSDDGGSSDRSKIDTLDQDLGIVLPCMKNQTTPDWAKTCINLLVFAINLYTLFFHTLFTEPETTPIDNENKQCNVKFDATPAPEVVAIEFMLFIIYLIIPVLIAKAIKFACENESLSVLKEWNDLDHLQVHKNMKRDLKIKKILSYLSTLLYFAVCVAVSSFALVHNCPSGIRPYDGVLLVFVFIFFGSGLFALIVPYNIIRIYTTFVRTRTALFQRDLKRDLAEYVS